MKSIPVTPQVRRRRKRVGLSRPGGWLRHQDPCTQRGREANAVWYGCTLVPIWGVGKLKLLQQDEWRLPRAVQTADNGRSVQTVYNCGRVWYVSRMGGIRSF